MQGSLADADDPLARFRRLAWRGLQELGTDVRTVCDAFESIEIQPQALAAVLRPSERNHAFLRLSCLGLLLQVFLLDNRSCLAESQTATHRPLHHVSAIVCARQRLQGSCVSFCETSLA